MLEWNEIPSEQLRERSVDDRQRFMGVGSSATVARKVPSNRVDARCAEAAQKGNASTSHPRRLGSERTVVDDSLVIDDVQHRRQIHVDAKSGQSLSNHTAASENVAITPRTEFSCRGRVAD
jgi:hypothetical protein